MPKLQRIKRANGSLVYSMNIPLGIIEELNWEKGMELSLEINGENLIIMVFKPDNKLNEEEKEKNDT